MNQLQLFTEKETSDLLRVPLQTLRNHRSKGKGLPYLKLGRSVRYSAQEIQEYLETRKIVPKQGGELI